MIHSLEISAPGRQNKTINVRKVVTSFGRELENDIVLLGGIKEDISFRLQNDICPKITFTGGKSAKVLTPGLFAEKCIHPRNNEAIPIKKNCIIKAGEINIALKCEEPAPLLRGWKEKLDSHLESETLKVIFQNSLIRGSLLTAFVSIAGLSTLILVAPQDANPKKIETFKSSETNSNELKEQEAVNQDERKVILSKLSGNQHKIGVLQKVDGRWSALFYVANAAGKESLDAKIDTITLPFEAKIYQDDVLFGLVTRTIEEQGSSARLVKVQEGKASIEIHENGNAGKIELRRKIIANVPGINAVNFKVEPKDNTQYLKESISAIWSGTNKYIVFEDGTTASENQKIKKKYLLRKIERNKILIEDEQKELTWIYLDGN
ncbi:hypothetical protein ABLN87_21475 [Ruegeria sp. SCPT10]|uniref:hypothetical protein n=1 Tax=Ruegeria sp. SCP10 TaxID=3141377 RepID=UPI00333D97BA